MVLLQWDRSAHGCQETIHLVLHALDRTLISSWYHQVLVLGNPVLCMGTGHFKGWKTHLDHFGGSLTAFAAAVLFTGAIPDWGVISELFVECMESQWNANVFPICLAPFIFVLVLKCLCVQAKPAPAPPVAPKPVVAKPAPPPIVVAPIPEESTFVPVKTLRKVVQDMVAADKKKFFKEPVTESMVRLP